MMDIVHVVAGLHELRRWPPTDRRVPPIFGITHQVSLLSASVEMVLVLSRWQCPPEEWEWPPEDGDLDP